MSLLRAVFAHASKQEIVREYHRERRARWIQAQCLVAAAAAAERG